ncbi:MAG: hypothetical protein M1812_000442 [Candelaria pacifica]|nr:MAG: hypothetical protein M1812_000442 [Candelaria pacifica]
MSSVVERRDKQVWEALENDNFKQALQLCQKRIKKGETGDNLLALKAYVLARSPPSKQREDGLAETKAFAFRSPPVVDLDALQTIQKALIKFSNGVHSRVEREISTLWDRATKALPGDEGIAREWFLASFSQRRWKDAQKAAMSLQRAFVRKREYYFWAILTSHFIKLETTSSEADRKLFGTLSYKLIMKAASDVPDDTGNLLSPGRAIQTPQELSLLLSIYQEEGYVKEALGVLDSRKLGIWSSVAKGDWGLVRLRLDLLKQLDEWPEAWTLCGSLLNAACPAGEGHDWGFPRLDSHTKGDDWKVWQCFIDACGKLSHQGSEHRLKTKETIDRFSAQTERTSRNSQQALLKFLSLDMPVTENELALESDRVSACKQYFERWSNKTCCFDDLKPYVQNLPRPAQMEFLEHIRDHLTTKPEQELREKTASSINVFKFDYFLGISLGKDSISRSVLETFVDNCIRVYKISLASPAELPTDNLPGDDACILAVMGLVRLADLESKGFFSAAAQAHLLQAAALLDFSLSNSQYSYQSMLLLMRLYLILGAPSLAMEVYPRLSIKQIQNDTLSHNLLTRLSTLHPFPITTTSTTLDRDDQDPMLCLGKSLQFYGRAKKQMPDMARLALEEGSYHQIRKFLEFEDKVDNSICKFMWDSERRRIARLVQPRKMSPFGSDANYLTCKLSDNRDYGVMLNFEADGLPRFEEYLRMGPKPGLRWLCASSLSEKLFTAFGTGSYSKDDRMSLILGHLRGIAQGTSPGEMTAEETDNMTIMIELTNLMMAVSSSGADTETNQESHGLDVIERWLTTRHDSLTHAHLESRTAQVKLSSGPIHPDWRALHESFLTLETLRALMTFFDYAAVDTKAPKIDLSKPTVARTKQLAEDVYQEIRSRSTNFKNALSETGVVGSFVEATYEREQDSTRVIGVAIEDLISEPLMEMFISRVVESWQEALDGVLRVKIK